jgi:glycine dehydrogenase
MVEPTESESLDELDRFCDAMISIRKEIAKIEDGSWSRDDNPLKHAPHTMEVCVANAWDHAYAREEAAFPAPWTRERKFWPSVGRLNNALGDRKLICSCPPIEDYVES